MDINHRGDKTSEKAKNYALYLLSCRPRTRKEIKDKITQKGFSLDIVETVINFLTEYNLINDETYARQWVDHRCRVKPTGRKRLFIEMLQKGISEDIIDNILFEISQEDEFNMALAIAEKKYRNHSTPQGMQKIKGFLYRRGFSTDTIGEVCAFLKGLNLDSESKNLYNINGRN
ncbi:MAG: regulatory protein RecX [Clostridia bacterium]|nr:regulatory protein RecX [Clostridia bacterium]